MTADQIKKILRRVAGWPQERQEELAKIALEIEAEFAGETYRASTEELEAIDAGLAGEAASEEEVDAAFARFRGA